MNIMELGAIGELVGGLAVIGSLIYVGLQVRQNSTWLRASVVDGASQWMASSHLSLASKEHVDLLDGLVADPQTLDHAAAVRIGQLFTALFRIQEIAHYHFRQGHYPPEIWEGHRGHLKVMVSSPFFESWWEMRSSMFNVAFCKYVDQVRASDKLDLARIVDPVGN